MGCNYPDSKVHGANMGPPWGQQDPDGPHVGPMNFAILVLVQIITLNSGGFAKTAVEGRTYVNKCNPKKTTVAVIYDSRMCVNVVDMKWFITEMCYQS